MRDVATPHGPARVELHAVDAPRGRSCSATARAAGSARRTWWPRATPRSPAASRSRSSSSPTAWPAGARRRPRRSSTPRGWRCSRRSRRRRRCSPAAAPRARASPAGPRRPPALPACSASPSPSTRREAGEDAAGRARRGGGARARGPGGARPVGCRPRRRAARSWSVPGTHSALARASGVANSLRGGGHRLAGAQGSSPLRRRTRSCAWSRSLPSPPVRHGCTTSA